MKKILFVIAIGLCFLVLPATVWAAGYLLSTGEADYWKRLDILIDPKYGGAITGVFDRTNFGTNNLVDDQGPGAMFQTAFWTPPLYHPIGCPIATEDQIMFNPTQAGYRSDFGVIDGNPIGVIGVTANPDVNEKFEGLDGNRTIHLKTKMVNYNLCIGHAIIENQNDWDTPFYLEQWISFHPDHLHTLVVRSKLINAGGTPKSVNSRQLPIIFGANVDSIAYWQNGQKIVTNYSAGTDGFDPDANWAAMINNGLNAGIGMVVPNFRVLPKLPWENVPRHKFNGHASSSQGQSILYFGGGIPDLRSFGVLNNVIFDATSYTDFIFSPGGSFEWTTYYPVGTLDYIKQTADAILSGAPPPSTPPTCSLSGPGTATSGVSTGYSITGTTGGATSSQIFGENSPGSGVNGGGWLPAVCSGNGTGCSGNKTFSAGAGTYWMICNATSPGGACSGNPYCSWAGLGGTLDCAALGFTNCGTTSRMQVNVTAVGGTPACSISCDPNPGRTDQTININVTSTNFPAGGNLGVYANKRSDGVYDNSTWDTTIGQVSSAAGTVPWTTSFVSHTAGTHVVAANVYDATGFRVQCTNLCVLKSVDILDLRQLLPQFTSIFDYNLVVGSFGK